MNQEFLSHLRNNPIIRYAVKHLSESGLQFTGNVHLKHTRGDQVLHNAWEPTHNTFTTEGMNYLLEIIFGTTSKAAAAIFYVGIFKNNVTPGLTDTAAAKLGAAGSYGECQDADYDSPATNKPAYTIAAAGSGSCTNASAAASFTMNASITVYGAFLSTATAKTATTGYLMAAKKFGTSRAVIADDILAVTYVVTATTS
jgi:hypothetical protein